MKKSFEEIALEIVKSFIEINTKNGYFSEQFDYQQLEDFTMKVKKVANELHENHLNRELEAFGQAVEEHLSKEK